MNKIKKVLVVDDSKLARITLARLLKNNDIEVLEADSVGSALTILETQAVDAIFLDVQMPEKDGFEGLKILKADKKLCNIPCSMYSGDLSIEAQQEAITNGAQAYLFKPANTESLEHVLKALSANIIADNMQQFAATDNQSPSMAQQQTDRHVKRHRNALITLDGRTRSLARLFNKEKQQTGNLVIKLNERLTEVSRELKSLKKQNEYSQHDDLLHKRAENDIRGQLQKTRDNLRIAARVAIAATVIALFALILAGIVYFSYISK